MLFADDTLRLRALDPADIDLMMRWENDTDLWRYGSTTAPFNRHIIWEYLKSYEADIYRTRQLRLIAERIDTGEPVGALDLFDFDPVNHHAMVGMLIDRAHQRRGYAKRCIALLADYARSLELHQLVAIIAADNEPCLTAFSRYGYSRVATLPQWLRRGDTFIDAFVLQMILDPR